jgi:muramoyltetrapeptide carboxypeptidase
MLAIVSPSSDLAGRYPRRLAQGRRALEDLGFRTAVMPHALETGRWQSAPRQARIDDLHTAFANEDVCGVFCAIGGRGAAALLGGLDYDLIAAHPKVFCGYSDATALHAAIGLRAGLVTFYGPSVLMELGDIPGPFPETANGLLYATRGTCPIGQVPAFADIVVEGADWDSPRERRRQPAPPPELLREGTGSGPLSGGCLPVITGLLGTPWEVVTSGRILLLETPQPPYTMRHALADLWHLSNAGRLDDLAGLVVGWPFALDQIDDLRAALLEAIPPAARYPILLGRPFGHTSPITTLPLGVPATLDGAVFSVDETATVPG